MLGGILRLINQDRLWRRIEALSEVGKQETGGVTRLTFSKEERIAKDLVAKWMKEAGLRVWEDAVGNLIGRKEGRDRNAAVVLTGSHLDSVYNGGNFDGPLGVLSSLEAVQTLNETGIETERPIEVIAFTDEEGARFRFGMTGSRGLAGMLTRAELEARDSEGMTIAQAMLSVGFNPENISEAARASKSVYAYVEVHIEQGRILERANLPVGVVTGIAGPLWLKFTITGQAGHAGTTPMALRHDALVGTALVVQVIEEESKREERTVGTVGQLSVIPGGVNIIPGRVEFTLDLRDVDIDIRKGVEQKIRERALQICRDRGLLLDVEILQDIEPVYCSNEIQNAVRTACNAIGIDTIDIVSGAGHDGMQLQDLCPIGMIFVRSKDGISHHPDEWSSKEDCGVGAEVLYHTLLALAGNSFF